MQAGLLTFSDDGISMAITVHPDGKVSFDMMKDEPFSAIHMDIKADKAVMLTELFTEGGVVVVD